MFNKNKFVACIGLSFSLFAASASAAWPDKPITLIVPWGAGGGTDTTTRIVGKALSDELGVPVNVVNRTGGQGVIGHSAIANAKPDGYTIGLMTAEITMMHWTGLTDLLIKTILHWVSLLAWLAVFRSRKAHNLPIRRNFLIISRPTLVN